MSLEKIKQETELVKLELQRHKLQLVLEGRTMSDVLNDGPVVSEGNQIRSTVHDLSDLRLVPKLNSHTVAVCDNRQGAGSLFVLE